MWITFLDTPHYRSDRHNVSRIVGDSGGRRQTGFAYSRAKGRREQASKDYCLRGQYREYMLLHGANAVSLKYVRYLLPRIPNRNRE